MKSILDLEEAGFLVKPLYPTERLLDELKRDLHRHIEADIQQHYPHKIIVDDVEYKSHNVYLETVFSEYNLFSSFYLTASSKPNDFIKDWHTDRTQTYITSDSELREFLYRKPYIHEIATSNQLYIITVIALADEIIKVKNLEIEKLHDIETETKTIYRVGA